MRRCSLVGLNGGRPAPERAPPLFFRPPGRVFNSLCVALPTTRHRGCLASFLTPRTREGSGLRKCPPRTKWKSMSAGLSARRLIRRGRLEAARTKRTLMSTDLSACQHTEISTQFQTGGQSGHPCSRNPGDVQAHLGGDIKGTWMPPMSPVPFWGAVAVARARGQKGDLLPVVRLVIAVPSLRRQVGSRIACDT
jgi:hypothetical protein